MSGCRGLVGQVDLVVFPVECVISHEAAAMVKRAYETAGTVFRSVRNASLASFVQAAMLARIDTGGSHARA